MEWEITFLERLVGGLEVRVGGLEDVIWVNDALVYLSEKVMVVLIDGLQGLLKVMCYLGEDADGVGFGFKCVAL